MSLFESAIAQAAGGRDLEIDQTSELIDAMLSGEADEGQVGQLLLVLRDKGEAVSELVGAALAMRRHMTRIAHHHDLLLDTCGTGGSGSGTFNISTCVAIVASACGVPVAKHGNRRATSHSGSADVLEHLGVQIDCDPESVAQRLDEVGLCFCFAPKMHPAMRHVANVRRQLGVRTLFNLLGPLCNPAGATHQLLGTSTRCAQEKIAQALPHLGSLRSFVVHAEDGQDEVSLTSTTTVMDVAQANDDSYHVRELAWTPASFGLEPNSLESLAAKDPAASAKVVLSVLEGIRGPARDTVVAGVAAALLLVGKVNELTDGVALAESKIDDGSAREKLQQLRIA